MSQNLSSAADGLIGALRVNFLNGQSLKNCKICEPRHDSVTVFDQIKTHALPAYAECFMTGL